METKQHLIHLNGYFDSLTVDTFKRALRIVDTKVIVIRINSYGGNLHVMNTLSALLYYMMKYKGHELIFEIERAESAALMLVLNFKDRRVTKGSVGSIHLPVVRPGAYVLDHDLDKKREEAIRFIASRTQLNKESILVLNSVSLNAEQMIQKGIATKLVESFT